MLATLIPVSDSLRRTGATDVISRMACRSLAPALPPAGALALILIVAMAITPFLNNAATVLVVAPIAAGFAQTLGFRPEAFLMAVAIGAGCDFLTPIGHQCNTLVMGPGGTISATIRGWVCLFRSSLSWWPCRSHADLADALTPAGVRLRRGPRSVLTRFRGTVCAPIGSSFASTPVDAQGCDRWCEPEQSLMSTGHLRCRGGPTISASPPGTDLRAPYRPRSRCSKRRAAVQWWTSDLLRRFPDAVLFFSYFILWQQSRQA